MVIGVGWMVFIGQEIGIAMVEVDGSSKQVEIRTTSVVASE